MASKVKPTDVTGRVREAQAAQFAEDTQKRANEMSMATADTLRAPLVVKESEVIDATKPGRQTVIVDEVVKVVKDEDAETVTIRVVENIDNMTLGAGNNYSFEAGRKYEVTRAVAKHLEEKGYLAGVI